MNETPLVKVTVNLLCKKMKVRTLLTIQQSLQYHSITMTPEAKYSYVYQEGKVRSYRNITEREVPLYCTVVVKKVPGFGYWSLTGKTAEYQFSSVIKL